MPGQSRNPAYSNNTLSQSATETDPVCGMSVKKEDSAIVHTHLNTKYFFCHQHCLTKFKDNPKSYIDKKSISSNSSNPDLGSIYFCPMHPEIVRTTKGDCPKCGMSLEAQIGDSSAELRYLKRRIYVALVLTLPIVLLQMSKMLHSFHWLELVLTIPVVFYSGSIFFQRAYLSIVNRSLNMFTLIALGIGTAFAYSAFAIIFPHALPSAFLDQHGAPYVYFEAAAIITILTLFGQLLESQARSRTNDSIQSLSQLAPKTARLISADGSENDVPIEQLKVGDVIRVRPGESVPADGVILQGNGLLDESIITGEPVPVEKVFGHKVIGSTINNTGSFTMRVEQVGSSSLLGQIISVCQQAQLTKAPIQQLVDQAAGYFVPAVILIALLTLIFWTIAGQYTFALINAIAVLIIACPCALGLATPMSITVAVGRGAHSGILIKQAKSLQLLSQIDTVVVDKTGTLTEGKPKVTSIIAINNKTQAELLHLVASIEIQSEHPLASAIIEEATKQKLTLLPCSNFWAKAGKGIGGTINQQAIVIGNAKLLQELSISTEQLSSDAQKLSEQGHSLLFIAINAQLAGLISVSDLIKPTTKKAISDLQKQNINIVMLTGDNHITAQAVAKELGISDVHSEVLPTDKAIHIKQLQDAGNRVAMAGDGINDAPALIQADVGIAMGTGTDIAMNQADVVLLKGDLQGIVRAITLSKATMSNIRTNLLLAFGYNIIAIPIAAGVLYPLFGILLNPMIASLAMSLSSVSVVANSWRLRNVKAS